MKKREMQKRSEKELKIHVDTQKRREIVGERGEGERNRGSKKKRRNGGEREGGKQGEQEEEKKREGAGEMRLKLFQSDGKKTIDDMNR